MNKEALFTSARTGELDRDEWRTPKWLYDKLNVEFRFTLDAAATYRNTLCSAWYSKDFQESGSGLTSPWNGSVFVNPPYSRLKQWVQKAFSESTQGHCDVVMLVPARTDTKAWWDYLRFGDVRFLPGRLKFDLPHEYIEQQELEAAERALRGKASKIVKAMSAPFPSAVVVFEKGIQHRPPTTYYWNVREPKKET